MLSSSRGTTPVRRSTGAPITSQTTSGPPSTSSRWSSATRATAQARAFASRDPSTGEPGLYEEFLADAQGEDVVAGIRTPEPLAHAAIRPQGFRRAAGDGDSGTTTTTCRTSSSPSRTGGSTCCRRGAKQTAAAALTAVDMVEEDLAREDAVIRIDPDQLDQLLHPMIDPKADFEVAATGLNASPGAAPARPCSTPTRQSSGPKTAKTSSSSAGRRRPTTSTG